jgi:GTP-binding protein
VGKSSILNAIVGRKAIARTSKTPGKTRECNVFRLDEQLYLVDLPGYGYARVSHQSRKHFLTLIERCLLRRSLAGVVWLLDVRREPSREDLLLKERLSASGVPVMIAVTKSDKLSRQRRLQRVETLRRELSVCEDQVTLTSAITNEGIDQLRLAVLTLGASGAS